jgi:hypothetical protein
MKGTTFDKNEIIRRLNVLKTFDYASSLKPAAIKERAQKASDLGQDMVDEYFKSLPSVKCDTSDLSLKVMELYEIYKKIILINDSYENLNGIGRVYGRARRFIPAIDTWIGGVAASNAIISKKGQDRFTMSNCTGSDADFGPYSRVYDQLNDNASVFGSDSDPNSISSVINTMAQVRYNAMYMSYGLSGSGKTHTLIGDSYRKTLGESGIAQLSLGQIIKALGNSIDKIEMKAIQVYKGYIYNCMGPNKPDIYKISNIDEEKGQPGIKYIKNPDVPMYTKDQVIKDTFGAKLPNAQGLQNYMGRINVYINTLNAVKPFDFKNFNTKMTGVKQTEGTRVLTLDIISSLSKDVASTIGRLDYMRNLLLLESVSVESFESLNPDYFKSAIIKPSEAFEQPGEQIKTVSEFNKHIDEVMKRRFTRSTMNNKDSSRSHLFVTVDIYADHNQVPITLAVADLAGSEDPFEFLGDASIEGYYVVDSLGQLKQIMESYNAAKAPPNELKSPGTRHGFLPRDEWAGRGKRVSGIEASSAMWNVMNKILHFGDLTNKDALFTKVMTFINTKTYVPKADKVLADKICEETADSLNYGFDLTQSKHAFGRRVVRRRTSRKRAKSPKRRTSKERKKRRSKRRSRRGSRSRRSSRT